MLTITPCNEGEDKDGERYSERGGRREGGKEGKKETCMTHATYTLFVSAKQTSLPQFTAGLSRFFMKGKLQRDSYNKRELT